MNDNVLIFFAKHERIDSYRYLKLKRDIVLHELCIFRGFISLFCDKYNIYSLTLMCIYKNGGKFPHGNFPPPWCV